jgi:hypothetical protein
MQDRQPGKPGQYKAMLTAAEFQKMQAGQQFTITMLRDDQPIVEGTPYSKAAVLPDDLAKIVCPNIANPTPADALRGHAINYENPHKVTAAQSGARPATYTYPSKNGGDCNSYLTETNLFVFNFANKPTAFNYGWFDVWRASGNGFSPNGAKPIILQRFTDWQTYSKAWRFSTDGGATFSDWAYDNPPMATSVEYATTKRYSDSIVYTKRINFGALPNKTTATVAHGITAANIVGIRCIVNRNTGEAFEMSFANDGTKVKATSTDIEITTDWNGAAYNAAIILEYIK